VIKFDANEVGEFKRQLDRLSNRDDVVVEFELTQGS